MDHAGLNSATADRILTLAQHRSESPHDSLISHHAPFCLISTNMSVQCSRYLAMSRLGLHNAILGLDKQHCQRHVSRLSESRRTIVIRPAKRLTTASGSDTRLTVAKKAHQEVPQHLWGLGYPNAWAYWDIISSSATLDTILLWFSVRRAVKIDILSNVLHDGADFFR